MINKSNWKNVNAYLQYRFEVEQVSITSQRLEKSWLRHLLLWADEVSFDRAPGIRPAYPQHLITARLDGSGELFSEIYINHLVRSAYRFFVWLSKHRRGFSSITPAWLDTLRVPKFEVEPSQHEAVTLEEILAMASAPAENLVDRRIRASAVFWFLSGIRVGAFVSLPTIAVDLSNLSIKQFPKLGVKTKLKKHAITYLLDIPELLPVVRDWDNEVRASGSKYWFAQISPLTWQIDPDVSVSGNFRGSIARKNLFSWLARVGLPYHSPHKFRHGHAVYALKQAKDVPALKAVSQNLMHKNLSITDGVYGILSDLDVKEQIALLGKSVSTASNKTELLDMLKKLISEHENPPNLG